MERAKAGDVNAFAELVAATQAEVYTLAYRLTGNEDDARDVAQDAYLRAFRGLKRFRGDARFSTWMYRITANCASTHLSRRSQGRHDELSDDDADAPTSGPSPTPRAMAEAGALRDRMTAALAELPPRRCGPSSCCATSTTCPTRPSPPSWGSPRRRPRSGCTGPAASCASGCSRCPERRRPVRSKSVCVRLRGTWSDGVSCAAVAAALPGIVDGVDVADLDLRRHVETCLRCQAELAQYRKVLRALHQLRTEVLEPSPGPAARHPRRPEAAGERGP